MKKRPEPSQTTKWQSIKLSVLTLKNRLKRASAVETAAVTRPAKSAEPLMDENVIKLSFGNNQNLLKKSMDIYLRDAPNLLASLMAAIEADDFNDVSTQAHALKGISSYYTRGGPFELARLLDLAAQKDPGPEMRMEIRKLGAALSQAVADLAAVMRERL